MHTFARLLLACTILLTLPSWGFFAHKQINQYAVYTLPPPLLKLYKQHASYITMHAVDPDKRRYINENEAARHYIDADAYGERPFDSIPRHWTDAEAKYTKDTLVSHGIVPWQIQRTYQRLVTAFGAKDLTNILRYSADLGHYIADANVPLHTTHNYNGQLTKQEGIHAFWESRLPELFANDYDFLVGTAHYIDKPLDTAWQMVESSFQLVDSVLNMEAVLSKSYAPSKKFAYERRLNNINRVYSRNYSSAYHSKLAGMVEKQMQKAVIAVGSYWYSAWVDAGQPALEDLLNKRYVKTARPTDSVNYDQTAFGRKEWQ